VPRERLAAGPGNLTAAFAIDLRLNGADLLAGPVRLEPGPRPATIDRGPRVGVDYAGDWTDRPLRYLIRDDPHRSRR
jgi:DNA-3-methyladenine glycosylase